MENDETRRTPLRGPSRNRQLSEGEVRDDNASSERASKSRSDRPITRPTTPRGAAGSSASMIGRGMGDRTGATRRVMTPSPHLSTAISTAMETYLVG